ncbi:MAG: bi-domain-containing oxidoreductase [Phycisphaeraceae bacterium]
MRQVVQNVRTGQTRVAQLPDPVARPGQVLIANEASLISAGTEKMVLELTRKSLLGKARERPDHVRRVIEKIRNEGFFETLAAVRTKLDEPMAMGYSSAGVVLACGAGVQRYKPGDRVASNGPHAGIVSVPVNLCARVPENVDAEHAAFGVIGAIAMQGVRLSRAQLGETVLVIGLGLVGQMTVSLLSAAGVRVIGTDPDLAKCELALRMGATRAEARLGASAVQAATDGRGADAVILTCSTSSNGPIEQAAEAVRQKGRVVVVGVMGMDLPRRPFYFKEAELVVSCSYGPGRYDADYEERGRDYPAAYVRWTEQRNIEAVLELMGAGKLDVSPLISHRFDIESAERAYELIERGDEPYLGIVLRYPEVSGPPRRRIELRASKPAAVAVAGASGRVGLGCIGAGNFARMVLLPAIAKTGAFDLRVLCSAGGLNASHNGSKLGFAAVTSDEADVLADDAVDAVFVVTRHDEHAREVIAAIEAGKHVFVEKPLALSAGELARIDEALRERGDGAPLVMVGFNRRFSPAAAAVREHFAAVDAPLTASVRFNAGAIPPGEWVQDDEQGGGRIVGEACHGIDLASYLVGAPPVRVYAESIAGPDAPQVSDDQCFITVRHANGGVSTIAYLAGGDRAMPKERVEVIGGGRCAVIDDFRRVTTWAGGRERTRKLAGKGHAEEVQAFADALRQGGAAPIAWDDLYAVSLASILAVRSLREGVPFEV